MKGLFVYGALLWDSAAGGDQAVPAYVDGYIRRFCIESVYGRGTSSNPGLVCGIERSAGARVVGKLLFNDDGAAEFIDRIARREMQSGNYTLDHLGALRVGATTVHHVYTLVANQQSPAYRDLLWTDQCKRIRTAAGIRGSALSYYERILQFVDSTGFYDTGLSELRNAFSGEMGL